MYFLITLIYLHNMTNDYIVKCTNCPELQARKPEGVEIWLPTIDDIINLVKQSHTEMSDYKLNCRFNISITQMCCFSYLQKRSLQELWIMFWMYDEFKKEWHSSVNKWM